MKKVTSILIMITLIFMLFSCASNQSIINLAVDLNGIISLNNNPVLLPNIAERYWFEEKILEQIKEKGTEKDFDYFRAFFILIGLEEDLRSRNTSRLLESWPILNKISIYILDSGVKKEEIYKLEEIIKITDVKLIDIARMQQKNGIFRCDKTLDSLSDFFSYIN